MKKDGNKLGRRKLARLNNNEGASTIDVGPRIITPFDENRVYVLNNSNKIPTYVMEVPGSRFEHLPICLATYKKSEVPRVQAMCRKFAALWEKLAENSPIIKP